MGDYILRSDDGVVMITISSQTPVDDVRYMIDNINRLKLLVECAMVEGMIRCPGCLVWCYPSQVHSSGAAPGYICYSPDILFDFDYFNMYGMNHICARPDPKDSVIGKADKCKITIPAKEKCNPAYVGKKWLDDWENFVR